MEHIQKDKKIGSATISGAITEITQEGVTATKGMGGPSGGGQGRSGDHQGGPIGMKEPKQ